MSLPIKNNITTVSPKLSDSSKVIELADEQLHKRKRTISLTQVRLQITHL